ncbi:pyridine nucleotide-disulfide oxidoreductase [Stutzerimonas stutzeri]|uniref:Pyridine nucleotide-disulfide oxidoreductase n=1 Tax=Stutzerimonas stutzeri TaxID=316 RepID=W8RP18_STUST|nr:FAD/NAD(P)-binding oxidoreductase [Stutzerimonas stutzeri]AHL73756.1 pyridine nucleotide-disulfide oxidoreductase [Stutzerimonas stutzeri]MCQ4328727.1 NAD(P)/FAD-dependent oxidoreductase [Stutzerimonas stutzeri]
MKSHYDILIVGAGPAGMAAALAAAPSGASIAVLDDNPTAGGQIWRDGPHVKVPPTARQHRQALAQAANIELHNGTRVVAAPGGKRLLLEDAEQGHLVGYDKLILCTGARELLLPFPGWTLPGVTGAGGLQALIKGGMPVTGKRLVIAGSGPLLLACAATAKNAGARLLCIAEQAPLKAVIHFAARLPSWPSKALQALKLSDRCYRSGTHVLAALGTDRVEAVRLSHNGKVSEIACDHLACGFGLIPNTELGQVLGSALSGGALRVDAYQQTSLTDHFAAGECTGFGGSELALAEGRIAGYAAVGDLKRSKARFAERQRWQNFADLLARTFQLSEQLRTLAAPDTLICRCEDVPYSAMVGHSSWVEAKLESRCGMGACQGRICGAASNVLFGWQPPKPRQPISPARIGTLIALPDAEPTAERHEALS